MLSKYFSLLSLCFVSGLVAQQMQPTSDNCCVDEPQEAFIEVRNREPNGIGYPRGYSSIDGFFIPSVDENFHPFLDARAHIFNDGKFASNVGLGLRYLPDEACVSYGANVYWDYSHARRVAFHQVGVGLEFLFPKWDIHLNSYTPVNRHKKRYKQGFSEFKGNNAILFRKYETAMTGGDLTIGYMLYESRYFDLHLAASGYYFQGSFSKHAGGGLIKLKSYISKYLTLEGQVSYDNLFKWIGQGEMGLRLPLGRTIKACPRKNPCCDLIALEKQLSLTPDRFEIIVTSSHKKKQRARDPITGQPLNFIFVNNISSSNGTFESPYPTLTQAQAASNPGDYIYAFPGDGSNLGSITLQNGQKLLGSGTPFTLSTSWGDQIIPALTSTKPLLFQIQVANDNTIHGLSFTETSPPPAPAFFITGSPRNLIVTSNDFFVQTTQNSAISIGGLNSMTGNIEISNNYFQATSDLINFIAIGTNGDFCNLQISENIFDASSPLVNDVRTISVFAGSSALLNATIKNNQMFGELDQGSSGISGSGSSTLNVYFVGNNANSNNNFVSGRIYPFSVSGSSKMTLNVEKNNFNGFSFASSGSSNLKLRLIDNQTTQQGYSLTESGASNFQLGSPNLALTGVQTINNGPITTSGTVTFFPINQ